MSRRLIQHSKKLFSNILVYAEAADAECLEQVFDLGKRHGAAISVCDVIEPPPRMADPEGTIAKLKTVGWQLAFERLRALCAPHMRHASLDYTVLTGNPFLAITEQVIQQRFDLVVHVSDPFADGAGPGLNPTGMHLVRKCPCAVWSMHPGKARVASDVVLAVDRDDTGANPRAERLAEQLAATAQAISQARGATLHVVHAWQPYAEKLLAHPRMGLGAEDIETYARAQEQDHQQWLDTLVARLDDSETSVVSHLLQGTVAKVIPELARQTGAELIVMGTIGTSAVPGVLVGTSAEAILSATAVPILALKPQGFTSPLRFQSEADLALEDT
jgi:nucleotide-binding universal stress UspA family protein